MMNDTFQFVKDLQAAGFTREQAEASYSLRYRNPFYVPGWPTRNRSDPPPGRS